MVQSTPSTPAGAPNERAPRSTVIRPLTESWPYIVVALGNTVVLFMMFQPWLRAHGWDGSATVNAFGRFRRSTRHLNLWSQSPPATPELDSTCAVLATAAILVTVIAAFRVIRQRDTVAEIVTAATASAVAILLLVDVHNLDNSIPQVRAAVGMSSDLTAQLGLAIGALRGTNSYPWPGRESTIAASDLTPWAFISLGISLASAAVMLTRSWRGVARVLAALISKIV
ncbi:hypothetical protein ACFVUS_27120 [Nocardia sp. NPDC058058]|uniref:hypothetical protein n=1 Tax=Nocardia sp. NPDC058058 TaxID=3346317 RepID=UPI0036D7BB1D